VTNPWPTLRQVWFRQFVWNLTKSFLSWALQFAIGVALMLSPVILHEIL